MEISDERLDLLIQEIEKVRRRKIINFTSNDNIEYLDPYNNLGKIKIPNNHLVLGRRGSGKTTLLLTTIKEDNTNFIFPIDCQIYRNTKGNDVIIDMLLRTLTQLIDSLIENDNYLAAEEEFNKKHKGFFKKLINVFLPQKTIFKYDEFLFLLRNCFDLKK